MRRILFSLVAVALLASCSQKPTFIVQGTVSADKAADSTKVYLQEDAEGKTLLDSTLVLGGSFEFKGVREIPYVGVIAWTMDNGKQFKTPVVLEAGKTPKDTIKVNATGEFVKVSGSPLNDIMQGQFDAEMKQMDDLRAIYQKGNELAAINKDDPALEELTKQIETIQKESVEKTYSFIKENANSTLAPYFMVYRQNTLNLEQQKELAALFPEGLKSDARVATVLENITKQEVVAVGQKFVDLKGKTPDGKDISLSDYAGKGNVVLLDFWASWCGPCIAEMPHVKEAYNKYHAQGFEIVAVSLDNKQEAWEGAIKELGITWPQMSDLKGWASEISNVYNVRSIPHTVLIDRDGTIVEKDVRGENLSIKVGELLNK